MGVLLEDSRGKPAYGAWMVIDFGLVKMHTDRTPASVFLEYLLTVSHSHIIRVYVVPLLGM